MPCLDDGEIVFLYAMYLISGVPSVEFAFLSGRKGAQNNVNFKNESGL